MKGIKNLPAWAKDLEGEGGWIDLGEPFHESAGDYAASVGCQVAWEMFELLDLGSASELKFATALGMMSRFACDWTGVGGARSKPPDWVERGLVIRAQVKLAPYIVDFVIDSVPKTRSIVVECDGHFYHERTKEQAARDRKRDRELQSRGYTVFRFTGSEIHRDAFGCVRETLIHLFGPIERGVNR